MTAGITAAGLSHGKKNSGWTTAEEQWKKELRLKPE